MPISPWRLEPSTTVLLILSGKQCLTGDLGGTEAGEPEGPEGPEGEAQGETQREGQAEGPEAEGQ